MFLYGAQWLSWFMCKRQLRGTGKLEFLHKETQPYNCNIRGLAGTHWTGKCDINGSEVIWFSKVIECRCKWGVGFLLNKRTKGMLLGYSPWTPCLSQLDSEAPHWTSALFKYKHQLLIALMRKLKHSTVCYKLQCHKYQIRHNAYSQRQECKCGYRQNWTGKYDGQIWLCRVQQTWRANAWIFKQA